MIRQQMPISGIAITYYACLQVTAVQLMHWESDPALHELCAPCEASAPLLAAVIPLQRQQHLFPPADQRRDEVTPPVFLVLAPTHQTHLFRENGSPPTDWTVCKTPARNDGCEQR